MSIKDAVLKFSEKELGKGRPATRRKNKNPEAHTVKQCMAWFKEKGFSMDIVEAKGVWNNAARRYLKGNAVCGMSDSVGCTPKGLSCFVEFKAEGMMSTLKLHQAEFLREKILLGGFACHVDRLSLLESVYMNWCKIKYEEIDSVDNDLSIAYLLSLLPKKFNL